MWQRQIVGIWVTFAALTAAQTIGFAAGPSRGSGHICGPSEFKPIRGYCSEDYLGFDNLWEVVDAARRDAFTWYFTINTGDQGELSVPEVQIRHDEDPTRSRRW